MMKNLCKIGAMRGVNYVGYFYVFTILVYAFCKLMKKIGNKITLDKV